MHWFAYSNCSDYSLNGIIKPTSLGSPGSWKIQKDLLNSTTFTKCKAKAETHLLCFPYHFISHEDPAVLFCSIHILVSHTPQYKLLNTSWTQNTGKDSIYLGCDVEEVVEDHLCGFCRSPALPSTTSSTHFSCIILKTWNKTSSNSFSSFPSPMM
jgi:hypothetical protein